MLTTGRVRGAAVALAVAFGLTATGCASTSELPGHGTARSCAGREDQDGPAAAAAQVAVVCRWSAALRAGDVRAAAGYFHLPSVFADGGRPVAIRTLTQAEVVNSSLPCGARVISAFQRGRVIDVLFRLTARAGHGGGVQACGRTTIGQTARTEFLIHDGRILEWVRAPSRPGDPGNPTTTSQGGGSPV